MCVCVTITLPFNFLWLALNEEAGYKRMVNWPIFRDSLALSNGDNY